jgi:hypothetical protein
MPDTFTPLSRLSLANPPAFVPLHLKLSTTHDSRPEKKENPPHSSETCASPKVTLQRDNNVVTGIRIECACGQVIELACVY